MVKKVTSVGFRVGDRPLRSAPDLNYFIKMDPVLLRGSRQVPTELTFKTFHIRN